MVKKKKKITKKQKSLVDQKALSKALETKSAKKRGRPAKVVHTPELDDAFIERVVKNLEGKITDIIENVMTSLANAIVAKLAGDVDAYGGADKN